MAMQIKKSENFIEYIGHFDSEVLCAKLTILADLYAIEHYKGYAKFKIEDEDKLELVNEKLDYRGGLSIYSNDGQTLLADLDYTLSTCTVTSTGTSIDTMGNNYTYSGSQTFLGFSITENATVPDSDLEVGKTFSIGANKTVYIVEGLSQIVKKIIIHPIVNGEQDNTTNLYPKTNVAQVEGLQTELDNKQNKLTTSSVNDGTLNKAIGFDSNGNLVKGTASSGGPSFVNGIVGNNNDVVGFQSYDNRTYSYGTYYGPDYILARINNEQFAGNLPVGRYNYMNHGDIVTFNEIGFLIYVTYDDSDDTLSSEFAFDSLLLEDLKTAFERYWLLPVSVDNGTELLSILRVTDIITDDESNPTTCTIYATGVAANKENNSLLTGPIQATLVFNKVFSEGEYLFMLDSSSSSLTQLGGGGGTTVTFIDWS